MGARYQRTKSYLRHKQDPERAEARTWKSADVRDFLLNRLPKGQGQPRVVLLDNASFHRSQAIQEALPQLRDQRIEPYFLPLYSPELNDIEPSCGRVKH